MLRHIGGPAAGPEPGAAASPEAGRRSRGGPALVRATRELVLLGQLAVPHLPSPLRYKPDANLSPAPYKPDAHLSPWTLPFPFAAPPTLAPIAPPSRPSRAGRACAAAVQRDALCACIDGRHRETNESDRPLTRAPAPAVAGR